MIHVQLLSFLVCALICSTFSFQFHSTFQSNKLTTYSLTQRRSISLSKLSSTATSSTSEISSKPKGGDSSVSTSTFNLAKSVIGAGVLSLPSGVAFFADEPSALIPSSIICAVFGLVAAYCFSSIGRICRDYEAETFQDAWSKSVGEKSAWIIPTSITALCFLASLAYSIIIGDSFTSLAETFNIPANLAQRSNVILAITTLVLLPLCNLKSLSALAPFSLLGLGGTLYTAIFMIIRFLDKSYFPGGKFFEAVALKPIFNARGGYKLNHLTFVLLSMLSTSYIAHYNAPQFYNQLKDTSLPKFNQVVGGAFGAAILFFILIMSIGFLTFGGATSGFVLNNYAQSDPLATIARFAIGLALLTSFPFAFTALREGVMDLLGLRGENRSAKFVPITFGLLAAVTSLALVLKDVGFVVSISGAMFGCFLMFVVPAIMNISDINKKNPSRGVEKLANQSILGTGVVMGVLGVYVSVMRQLGKL